MNFKYRGRSPEDIEKRKQQTMGANSCLKGMPEYKVQSENRLRILPSTDLSIKHWGMDVYMHYGVGMKRLTFVCPMYMDESHCPICDEREQALKDGDMTYAKDLEPKRRVLVWVLDRLFRSASRPLLWLMPISIDNSLLTLAATGSDTGGVLNIDDPQHGFDISFLREGQGRDTKYTGLQIARRESAIADNSSQYDNIIRVISENPLKSCYRVPSEEELTAAFCVGRNTNPTELDSNNSFSNGNGAFDSVESKISKLEDFLTSHQVDDDIIDKHLIEIEELDASGGSEEEINNLIADIKGRYERKGFNRTTRRNRG